MAMPSEDEILVGHYLKIWDSYGTPPEHYRPDAAARILSFIRSGREERRLTSFLAVVDGDIAVLHPASCTNRRFRRSSGRNSGCTVTSGPFMSPTPSAGAASHRR